MSIVKHIADAASSPEEGKKQCTLNPECHRVNGHEPGCKTIGVVFVENALELARGWARRMKGSRHGR